MKTYRAFSVIEQVLPVEVVANSLEDAHKLISHNLCEAQGDPVYRYPRIESLIEIEVGTGGLLGGA